MRGMNEFPYRSQARILTVKIHLGVWSCKPPKYANGVPYGEGFQVSVPWLKKGWEALDQTVKQIWVCPHLQYFCLFLQKSFNLPTLLHLISEGTKFFYFILEPRHLYVFHPCGPLVVPTIFALLSGFLILLCIWCWFLQCIFAFIKSNALYVSTYLGPLFVGLLF